MTGAGGGTAKHRKGRATGISFRRSSYQVEGSQTEREHSKSEKQLFRIHFEFPLSIFRLRVDNSLGSTRAAAAGYKASAAVDCHLKATTTLFGIGLLGSVIPIADATLFSGSITAMTTACAVTANVEPANGSGSCRNSRDVDRSQTERQHGKFKNEFFRIHIFETPFERENPNAPGRRRNGRRVIFPFLKSRNGKTESPVWRGVYRNFLVTGEALPKSVRVRNS
jgi:hypothetical protein